MTDRDQQETIVNLQNVTKKFGRTTAVDRLTMSVQKGQIHGFLGPNGAGKSTTLRILLGQLRKTSGDAKLFGKDPWGDAVQLHKRLAYVPGEVNFWPQLTGGEIIDVLTDLRGTYDKQRRKELLETFELDPTKKFRTYSKGNRQKVALIAALCSDVELYIFDEPTSGLDPLLEVAFQKEVLKLKERGKAVLLSSHILAEVEALCDYVTIIRHGTVVESASLRSLRSAHRTIMTLQTTDDTTRLSTIPGVHELVNTQGEVRFEFDDAATSGVLTALSKMRIRELRSYAPTLEELFLRHYDDAETVVKEA